MDSAEFNDGIGHEKRMIRKRYGYRRPEATKAAVGHNPNAAPAGDKILKIGEGSIYKKKKQDLSNDTVPEF
jgi:hypothetical protein